jgi:hypothetical protein
LQADGIHITGPVDTSTVATVAVKATETEGTRSDVGDNGATNSG